MYALVFIKRYEYSFKKELTIKHKDGLSGLFFFFFSNIKIHYFQY